MCSEEELGIVKILQTRKNIMWYTAILAGQPFNGYSQVQNKRGEIVYFFSFVIFADPPPPPPPPPRLSISRIL